MYGVVHTITERRVLGVIPPPHAGKQTQKKEKKSEKAPRVGRSPLPQPKMSRGGRERPKKEEAPPSLSLSFASRRPWPEAAEAATSQRRKRKRWLMDAFNAYDGVCGAGGDGSFGVASFLPKAGGGTAHATSPNVFGWAAEPKLFRRTMRRSS